MTGSNSFGNMKPTLKKPLDGENAVHLHIHIYKKSAKTGIGLKTKYYYCTKSQK